MSNFRIPLVSLSNGVQMPALGFGTYKSLGGTATTAIAEAVEVGYRLIDTASLYENEEAVGAGIRKCGVPRDELFMTTKVWNTEREYGQVLQSCDRSLRLMGLDYLDLLLIHWPATERAYGERAADVNREMWRAFEDLYAAGKVRAIGVSNYLPHHLAWIMNSCTVTPMVNQLELHPGWPQEESVAFCRDHNIVVEAWSPLARQAVLQNDVLQSIATRHDKTTAQVTLRWELQNGIVPLPKTTHRERMEENADVFDFELSSEELAAISALRDVGGKCVNPDETDT